MGSKLNNNLRESGFTVIELLVVLVIFAILFGLASVNLGSAQTTASLNTVTNTLLADIKNQQILAMTGNVGSTSSAQPQGLYFQSNSYTLFAGPTYNITDTNNFTINTNQVNLSSTFPSNQLIFNKGNGSISGFTSGSDTITLSENGKNNIITLNRYGATRVN